MRNIINAFFVVILTLSSSTLVAAQLNPRIVLQTDLGQLVIELFPHEAPITVKNFLEYVDNDFYNDTIFQRVVPGFFIQGGGLTADFSAKATRAAIKNEAYNGLKNDYQMVAMVHTTSAEASGVDSATSQFIINMQNNPALNVNGKNSGYTVFGKVIEGIEIAEKISLQPRGMHEQFPEAPNAAIHILKIQRISSNKTTTDVKTEVATKATEKPHSGDISVGAPE